MSIATRPTSCMPRLALCVILMGAMAVATMDGTALAVERGRSATPSTASVDRASSLPAASDPLDPDGDGLPSDWEVQWSRTSPDKADSDGDGRSDGGADPDKDGLNNRREFHLVLNPHRADTDRDGVADGDEDTDQDGLTNRQELGLGFDPSVRDTDGDGVSDGREDLDADRLSTAFEIRRSKTDPERPDSDKDGIRDGAEDPDRDRLSNAGEERAGTRPRSADSDNDGTDDWHEDANHNGRSNGSEQDRRPVPKKLTPALADASRALPAGYADGCHIEGNAEVPHICSYYGTDSSRSIFLVGDSHGAHWQPALMAIAKRHGWRLYASTKSSCPVATVTVYATPTETRPSCDVWREAVFQKIAAIHPDLVVAADRNDYNIVGGYEIDSADNQRVWHDGMVTSLARLKDSAGKVVLLGDTPQWSRMIPACLRSHLTDMSLCTDRMSRAISKLRTANDRSAAADAGVPFKATAPLICPYDPCPVIIDRFLITRDDDHITPQFSVSVSRGLERLLPAPAAASTRKTKRHH